MTHTKNSRRVIGFAITLGTILGSSLTPSFAKDPATSPPKPTKKAALTFKRIGGFAGFHDDLMIYADGSYATKAPRHRPKSGRQGTLDAAQKKSLTKLLTTFGRVSWSRGNAPNVADGMQEAITINGSGKQKKLDPRSPEFRQIQELCGRILRPAPRK